jgi:hypothetical protein
MGLFSIFWWGPVSVVPDGDCRIARRAEARGVSPSSLPLRSSYAGHASPFGSGVAAPRVARRAKRGGGGRTRTCEAMRRLIYSQLPLPLGTLPRSMTVPSGRLMSRRRTCHGREDRDLRKAEGRAAGRVYGRRGGAKSTKPGAKSAPSGGKNCQNPEPVTQAQG